MNADMNAAAASSSRSNKLSVARQPGEPEFLVIGEVLRPHGVRGEVRMRVLTEDREQLPALEYVYLASPGKDKPSRKLELAGVRFNKAYALLAFAGCKSRDDAEKLRGLLVMIDMDQATPLEAGQYYLFQLIGLRVVADGVELGNIKEVLQTGANDVYIVSSERHGELLIPAHAETIAKIDFEAGAISMSLPEGILPG